MKDAEEGAEVTRLVRTSWTSNDYTIVVLDEQLQHNTSYAAMCRCTNAAFMNADNQTQTMTADFTPPVCVMSVESHHTNLALPLQLMWDCSDPESGLRLPIIWSLGTTPSGRDVVSLALSRTGQSSLADELEAALPVDRVVPVDGMTYYLSLSVTNDAGLSITYDATPIIVDSTPPVVASVLVPSATSVLSSNYLFHSAYEPFLVTWTVGDDQSGVFALDLCAWLCNDGACKFADDAAEVPLGAHESCVPVRPNATSAAMPSVNQLLTGLGVGGVETMADAPLETTTMVMVLRVTNRAGLSSFKHAPVVTAVWRVGVDAHCTLRVSLCVLCMPVCVHPKLQLPLFVNLA